MYTTFLLTFLLTTCIRLYRFLFFRMERVIIDIAPNFNNAFRSWMLRTINHTQRSNLPIAGILTLNIPVPITVLENIAADTDPTRPNFLRTEWSIDTAYFKQPAHSSDSSPLDANIAASNVSYNSYSRSPTRSSITSQE